MHDLERAAGVGRQAHGRKRRVVAANGEQRVDAELLERRRDGLEVALVARRVGARDAEVRAAAEVDPADSSMVSGTAHSVSPCISHLKPSRMPSTLAPRSTERIVAAPITLLMPGAGPPPHRMPMRFVLVIGTKG